MVAEGLPAQLACRVLDVSESGFYAWRSRAPSERAIRHAILTDLILQIHVDFRGVYGYRRVHAELTLGHGLAVGEEAVWLLMRKAGLQGLTGRPEVSAGPAPALPHALSRPVPSARVRRLGSGDRGGCARPLLPHCRLTRVQAPTRRQRVAGRAAHGSFRSSARTCGDRPAGDGGAPLHCGPKLSLCRIRQSVRRPRGYVMG